jgi:hypothetical protein
LNDKWLGIKEKTVHHVTTTFKNIKLNKLGNIYTSLNSIGKNVKK